MFGQIHGLSVSVQVRKHSVSLCVCQEGFDKLVESQLLSINDHLPWHPKGLNIIQL